ncbi:hypothetical protein HO133_002018 [Letharia lupina]|uniref:HTH APSES-type domain-containing protein n=1 Tax=Letharia lupina TaxID=560253 RepID=A0A8H6FB02_9LECA|nr:uncharacterized protein HO133_002018 [Letharia lupina]KAF6221164.1 hypothetical protein HO133_002018 [Letharia lupina]
MAPGVASNGIYSATYSGVPVFEFNVEGNHVMRRRRDHYINATHILKVADYDKPARTRILEREVQKGAHEKIQGGYGKYQGTWVPLREGRLLAERNGVIDKLRPIFDYVPGDSSPPPAPKHTTNSNKPKIPKAPNNKKIPKPKVKPTYSQLSEDYDNISTQLHDDDSQDNSTIASASFMDEDDRYVGSQYDPHSRKRKRGQDVLEQQHMLYADELLDYFMLSTSDAPLLHLAPPVPPEPFEINRPIDDQAHTALHWGAAMGDIDIVRFFIERGASLFARNKRGETPLIRAVLFTNNYEKETMPKLVQLLVSTIREQDNHGGTILHHIAMTTNSLAKKRCARYYLDIVLNKMAEVCTPQEFTRLVNLPDASGDTALHIVGRHNAKKCIRALQGRGVRGDLENGNGETADRIIQGQRAIRQDFVSSSPLPDFGATNGHELVKASKAGPASHYHSQSARSFSQSFGEMAQDKSLQVALAYDSEIKQKDDDLEEGQRLVQNVDHQLHSVRQGIFRHLQEGTDSYDNEEEEHRLREEERRLTTESESLSEQIQHKELHHAVRSEEQALPPSAHRKPNSTMSNEHELEEQKIAALALAEQQNKRRKLTSAVVVAQGAAGMSGHGETLKQLVSNTCGVHIDEVSALAPELLEELQQSKMEVGTEVAALA